MSELGETAKGRVRPDRVMVDPPGLDDAPGIIQASEEMFVEALVAQTAVETLHEGILVRFAWHNIAPLDPGVLDPFKYRMAGELGPVVRDDHPWLSAVTSLLLEVY